LICVKLTAKKPQRLLPLPGQIICHPKNTALLADAGTKKGDKTAEKEKSGPGGCQRYETISPETVGPLFYAGVIVCP
jgi:hypothetical protein